MAEAIRVDTSSEAAVAPEPAAGRVMESVRRVVLGKDSAIRLTLCALLAGGHVLIEDRPGVGKTTLAKALAMSLGCLFKRVQFTPDLLPTDITGTSVYNQKGGEFEFRAGPVFTNVLLADEINRTTPKTQASLLEAMDEFQVTADGVSYPLPRPFFVIATENDIEYQGTYPLPEAQMDRFLLRIEIGYPSAQEESQVLLSQMDHHPLEDVTPVTGPDEIMQLQARVHRVHVEPALRDYIVSLVSATRVHQSVRLGASPRGSLGLLQAARAWAVIDGRDYCLPDDIKTLAAPVLAHRLVLTGSRTGATQRSVIAEALAATAVPVF